MAALDELMSWLLLTAAIRTSADPQRPATKATEEIQAYHRLVQEVHQAGQQAEHQVEKLLQAVGVETE